MKKQVLFTNINKINKSQAMLTKIKEDTIGTIWNEKHLYRFFMH